VHFATALDWPHVCYNAIAVHDVFAVEIAGGAAMRRDEFEARADWSIAGVGERHTRVFFGTEL
jgi:hypothetical protein